MVFSNPVLVETSGLNPLTVSAARTREHFPPHPPLGLTCPPLHWDYGHSSAPWTCFSAYLWLVDDLLLSTSHPILSSSSSSFFLLAGRFQRLFLQSARQPKQTGRPNCATCLFILTTRLAGGCGVWLRGCPGVKEQEQLLNKLSISNIKFNSLLALLVVITHHHEEENSLSGSPAYCR